MRTVLLFLLLAPSLACAQAGRLLLAAGDVTIVRGAQEIRATAGTAVQSGDTIRVGPRSNVQLRLSDESIIALRQNTVFRIDEYAYAGPNNETSRSFFSLVRGGMRTVGGAIARQQAAEFLRTSARPEAPSGPQPAAAEKKPRPEESKVVEAIVGPLRTVAGALTPTRHAVRVPTATIGVRGTHYTIVHCDNDCYEPRRTTVASLLAQSDAGSPAIGDLAPNGTYAAVSDGRVIVYTNRSPVEFGAQEFFYVASMDSGPQSLIGPPSFLFDRLAGQDRQRGRGAPETTENMQRAGLNAESRPSDPPVQPSPPTFVVTETRTESGTLAVLPTSAEGLLGAFSPTSGTAGTFGAFSGEGTLTTSGSDSSQVLLAFSVSNPALGSFSGTAGSNVVNQTEPNAINAYWGIWFDGSLSDGRSTTPIFPPTRAFHYLAGPTTPPEVIAAKIGTLSFNLVGGTTPLNNLGESGSMLSGSMSMYGPVMVDFTKRNVSFPEVTFAFPTSTWWFGADSAPITIQGGGAHITKTTSGSFSCTDVQCGSQSATLQRTGIFMGPAGTHLGVAHNASTMKGPDAMQTIKVFSCAPNC